MRKISIVLFSALLILLTFCSCAGKETPDQYSAIFAAYSVHNEEHKGKFIVEVQDLGGVYADLYDRDGLYVNFYDGVKIKDKEGKPVSQEDLEYGDMLEVRYDGKLRKNNPKTIKAYEIIKY